MPGYNGQQLLLRRAGIVIETKLRQPFCNAPLLGAVLGIASSEPASPIMGRHCAACRTVHF
jgi:hypothetical protein